MVNCEWKAADRFDDGKYTVSQLARAGSARATIACSNSGRTGARPPTYTNGGRGWLGRAGVGCDYQFAQWFVFGAFGDFDWMNLKSNGAVTVDARDRAGLANEKESAAWYAGLRLGYLPYPNLLTFVSGGWTQTRFDQPTSSTL
jgi:hypothetical protein